MGGQETSPGGQLDLLVSPKRAASKPTTRSSFPAPPKRRRKQRGRAIFQRVSLIIRRSFLLCLCICCCWALKVPISDVSDFNRPNSVLPQGRAHQTDTRDGHINPRASPEIPQFPFMSEAYYYIRAFSMALFLYLDGEIIHPKFYLYFTLLYFAVLTLPAGRAVAKNVDVLMVITEMATWRLQCLTVRH